MELTGRRALVTGASSHLGAAIANGLARKGARVAVNHRHSPQEAAQVAASLPTVPGGAHIAVQADVSDGRAVEEMVEGVVDSLGGLEILVNNAGPYGATPLSEVDDAEWNRVIDTSLKGSWLCARAAAPHMRRSGWGRVINLSAVSAGVRNRGAYGFAKAGVEDLTAQLALELAPYATVNAIAPGQILDSLEDLEAFDPDWAAAVTEATPLQRLVTRAQLGEVVAAMCSEAFSSMTGVTITIDGGLGLNVF